MTSETLRDQNQDRERVVRAWLLSLWVMVLMMVVIGGITRLTGSGLSIVEWRPVTGILPPLSEAAWQEAFAAYQRSPQFSQQNHWMLLADFKRIFFWEYLHRLFGRALGFATAVPWLYFMWRKRMSRAVAWRTFAILVFGGLQGAVGWFMVKSGLVNEPRVSHYRLALHLLLGISVGQLILWQVLGMRAPRLQAFALPAGLRRAAVFMLPLLALQLVYGAFMAGTHAGYLYATFPDMNGRYAPSAFFTAGGLAHNLFDNPITIHYVHRALALVVFLYATLLAVLLRRERSEARAASYLLLGATLGQALLGALTVVLHMPIGVAVAHQAGAYVLCSTAVLLAHAVLGATPSPVIAPGLQAQPELRRA